MIHELYWQLQIPSQGAPQSEASLQLRESGAAGSDTACTCASPRTAVRCFKPGISPRAASPLAPATPRNRRRDACLIIQRVNRSIGLPPFGSFNIRNLLSSMINRSWLANRHSQRVTSFYAWVLSVLCPPILSALGPLRHQLPTYCKATSQHVDLNSDQLRGLYHQ